MALRKAKLYKTLSVSGKNNNKIFRIENDEVFTEDQINNFDELLDGGFIKLVEEEAKEVKEETPEVKKEAPKIEIKETPAPKSRSKSKK